jgi:hypothetical protein
MPRTLKTYLAAQDEAVLASFLDWQWCICAAISLNDLEQVAARNDAILEPVAGGDWEKAEAVVVRRRGFAELWVRARRTDYTTPFLIFAERYYDFVAPTVPPGYEVDHLFSKGRVARTGDKGDDQLLPPTTLVRILLVDARVNASFGPLMEGAMIGSGNPLRPVRRFTYLQLAKALSIPANVHGGGLSGRKRAANLGHIVDEFDRRGVLAGLGMGREQMMAELMTQAETVRHFRKLRRLARG